MAAQDSSALMKVLAGILEDAVRALQRIEKKIGDQGKIFNDLTDKLNKIEKTIGDSVTVLAQKEIPNLERTLTQKINDLGLQNISQIDEVLDQTIIKLQKSIQILSIQNLISRIESLAAIRAGPAKVAKKETKAPAKEKETTKATETKETVKVKPMPKPPVAKSVAEQTQEEEKKDEESLIKPSSFFGS